MTIHEIRHRLVNIAKMATKYRRECGYAQDFEHALDNIVVNIVHLGDDLDKSTGEEKV